MANTRISALPAGAALAGAEILPGVQSGANVGITASQLQAFATGFPGWVSGNWYVPWGYYQFVNGGGALVQNSIRLQPFLLPTSMTVKGLAGRVTTAGSSNIQFALYAHNASTGRPTGNALCSTGNIANTSTGIVGTSGDIANTSLAPGVYWMAVNCNDAACVMLTANTNNPQMSALIGSATLSNINPSNNSTILYLSTPATFNTWPSLTGATFTEQAPSGAGGNASAILFLQSN